MERSGVLGRFDLTGRFAVITGGGGLLGVEHAAAIMECGGSAVLLDINAEGLQRNAETLKHQFGEAPLTFTMNVCSAESVLETQRTLSQLSIAPKILINNAARNPVVSSSPGKNFSRLESFPLDQWELDLQVGLTGAFNCCKVFGSLMAQSAGGVIINVSSDLGVIAPDQRLYKVEGLASDRQPVKPVTYSVVKHGIIGLTKYIATYWADRGVRCNALSPGGVRADQSDEFVSRIEKLIPVGRMANRDEYRGAIAFLSSDASTYMNGANLIVDGGRSVW
jgi:NAD(P)-dependent dehydrogenase (short-subunit alcohol dehydrogenase family)